MDDPKIKVLCITGWCRNGSTIIGNILNEVEGLFHVGELHFLWRNAYGAGANDLCGCGRRLTQCALWSRVLSDSTAPGLSAEDHAGETVVRQRACVRTRHTWRVLDRGLWNDSVRAHAATMARTYRSIARQTGCNVLVDTSKIPGEAALLTHIDDVEPFYVHLVRDPRAVAQSWSSPKDYVHALSPWTSTAYWVGFNLASEAVTRRNATRSIFLRYEDFITDPAATLHGLIAAVGADPALNPLRDRTVELHTNHTVTGNPDRFRDGTTVIRRDDDGWRRSLPPRPRAIASAVSWPLRRRYGYA